MNSIKVSETRSETRRALQPTDRRRQRTSVKRQPSPHAKLRANSDRAIAAETTVKIIANLTISVVAISALVQLLPSYQEQKQKLQEISQEVQRTENRVQRLRSEFSHNFDPQQTQKIMQEQTELQDPQQLQIIWKENNQPIREAPQKQTPRKPANSLPTDQRATALVDSVD